MTLHSKFLVHWTGHNFHKKCAPITRDIRDRYVERLRDYCLHGLFMKPGTETIDGSNNSRITARISRVCFSEIRLSQAEDHARDYGMLGIGFHRDFVIERESNPVLYVQNGEKGAVIENLAKVHGFVDTRDKAMLRNLEVALGYLKNMSNQNDTAFKFYEEMEWRVVHLDWLMGKYITAQDAPQDFYRLKINPHDVTILVFPDHETKKLAISDPDICGFFADDFPMITIVSDCGNF